MKLSLDNYRTRAYIRAACPPVKMAPDGPRVPWDPKRREFRDEALKCFRQGRPREFRSWLEETYPKWRHSPTAQFLVGVSYFFEHRLDEALRFYQEAERNWRELEELGELREPEASWIRNSLASNFAFVARAHGNPEEAYRLLWMAVEASLPETPLAAPEIRVASRTLWTNLLRLAAIQRDEARTREVFAAMSARHPEWNQDEWLASRLRSGPELAFVRHVLGGAVELATSGVARSGEPEPSASYAEAVPM